MLSDTRRAQRFGHDGGNVEQGRAMLAREIRVRHPKKKGLYLSAVRSFVFNEVLALRIQQGLWGQTLPGDVMDPAGRPTGPLWGRGRVTTTDSPTTDPTTRPPTTPVTYTPPTRPW